MTDKQHIFACPECGSYVAHATECSLGKKQAETLAAVTSILEETKPRGSADSTLDMQALDLDGDDQ